MSQLDAWRGGDEDAGKIIKQNLVPLADAIVARYGRLGVPHLDDIRGVAYLALCTLRAPKHNAIEAYASRTITGAINRHIRKEVRYQKKHGPYTGEEKGSLTPWVVRRRELEEWVRKRVKGELNIKIVLLTMQDMSGTEIAAKLGIHPKHVSRIRRGVGKMLRKEEQQ